MDDAAVWDILESQTEEQGTMSEDGMDVLQNFLWQVEAAMLTIDSAVPAPALPTASGLLAAELLSECEGLLKLLPLARAGNLSAVLASPALLPLAAALSVDKDLSDDLPHMQCSVDSAGATIVAGAPPRGAAVRRLSIMMAAIASLQLFVRANWTGPPPECDVLGSAAAPAEQSSWGKAVMEVLEVDGEPIYELTCGVGYLWLAATLLGTLPSSSSSLLSSGGWSLSVWRARCAFAWQQSLIEASERGMGQSPWLFRIGVCDLVSPAEGCSLLAALLDSETLAVLQASTMPALHQWRNTKGRLNEAPGPPTVISSLDDTGKPLALAALAPKEESDEDAASLKAALLETLPAVRATLLIEFCTRLCWYGRVRAFDAVHEAACALVAFAFEVTGVLGIKRKYQTEEFSQLVVKAGLPSEFLPARETCRGDDEVNCDVEGTRVPENLKLLSVDDMTDVLEKPKFSSCIGEEDRALLERPLGAVEQVILLARCHYLWVNSNPNDEMVLQQLNALAQRVLITQEMPTHDDESSGPLLTANWLNFSCGLWYRCRAEHHRNKTRERAAFQLQALVDQFNDARPSADHRLLLAHTAGYPARFHLQREMGTRMMNMGMVSTAHEQFKKLRMWPEAIDCLMVAERNVEALDLVKELLEQSATPRLWCCLGDLQKDPSHYEKAWEVSKGRFARAQRSLGRHHFSKGDLARAVDAFALALDINPLHADVWFTMGCAQMRLERWEDAASTFSRCLGVNDENGEAWANLAAVHSALGKLQQARNCMVEATRRCRDSWRMWESFLGICMQLRDIQGCIQGLRRLVELGMEARVQERVLGMLTAAVVSDQAGLFDQRTGRAFAGQLGEFFQYLTSRHASEPFHWRFYAELQAACGQAAEALETRLKQSRSAKARLFETRDPAAFASQLDDFLECLTVVEGMLFEPALAEQAHLRLQAFGHFVRDVAKQLQSNLESCVQQPKWFHSHEAILALDARLQAAVASASTTASCA